MEDKKGSTYRRSDRRVSPEQLEYLFNYMSHNVLLREGKLTATFTKTDRRREWDSLAATLNSLGGAIKHTNQWRKTWNDQKGYVRNKAARIRSNRSQTGKGREGPVETLSRMEEGLLNVTGWVAATGDTSVPEAGILTSDSMDYSYTDSVNQLYSCIQEVVIEGDEHSYLKGSGSSATVTGCPSATVTGCPSATVTGGPSATVTGGPSATVTGGPSATVTGGPSATVTGPAALDNDDPSVSAVVDEDIAPATATGPSNPPNQSAKRSTLSKKTEMALKELKCHSSCMERNCIAVERMAADVHEMKESIKSIAYSIQKLTDHIINEKD